MAQSVKPADAAIRIGEVFMGKYRVEAILGQGGMGVVAECTHLTLNERVALKMLRQDVMLDQDAKARFLREAQAAAKLKSEYVAKVSDVGTFESGVPYMVMEFLEGLDLGELLKQRGVLPVQWAVELMLQTAEALCEAHSLGIVHRDVKPTNLFVTWRPDGSALIKVLDFGISKSATSTDMHLTQTQSLLGTPAYMSPEQMRSARLVDNRTDIWSLGSVFYEALEGRKPFEAESFSEMCVKVAVDPPAPMQNTPSPIQQIILRCLAKSPDQRYMSMAELARDLVPFAPDPHNAQMLVDRMVRMLRRANIDWEGGGTGTNRPAVPRDVRDLGSGPVRAQTQPAQWGTGSDPAGTPWNPKSDPSMRPWHGNTPPPRNTPLPFNELSQPFGRPLQDEGTGVAAPTVAAPPSGKRTGLIVALLGVAAAAVIGIGVWKATSTSNAPSQQVVEPAGSAAPAEVVMPATASGSAAGSAAIAPVANPAAGSGATPATPTETTTQAATPAAGDKPDGVEATDKPDKKTGTNTKGSRTRVRNGGATSRVTTKVEPKVDPVKVPDKKVEPPKPECDPFTAMHGCNK